MCVRSGDVLLVMGMGLLFACAKSGTDAAVAVPHRWASAAAPAAGALPKGCYDVALSFSQ